MIPRFTVADIMPKLLLHDAMAVHMTQPSRAWKSVFWIPVDKY